MEVKKLVLNKVTTSIDAVILQFQVKKKIILGEN